ncbi:MAG: vWA domain-containing protein [Aestuariivirgaceae bacterium]
MNRLLAWFRRFVRDDRAAVALVFGVSVVPFMLAAGVALDYSRALDLKTEMQAALDAGALAAASSRSLSDGERITLAKTTFTSNFRSRFGVVPVPTVTLVDGTVRASAAAALPTAFMKLAGIPKVEVGANVQIGLPGQRDAEIALVLDYSGSMNGPPRRGGRVKYQAMRDAAFGMIDDLTAGEGKHVKFALVPFSQHVLVSLPGSMVVGQQPGTTWTGCTQDRKYPFNLSVTAPDPDEDETKWGQPSHLYGTRPCGSYLANGLVLKPLSDDHAAVKRQIDGMRPYDMTHIALGFEFGWHVLSSNAPFTEGVAEGGGKTVKVLVLLTDGNQTEQAFGPDGSESPEDGERNLEQLCRNAKAAGITVATVAFDLDESPSTVERLRDCASDPSKLFFDVASSADLAAAFDGIRSKIQEAIFIAR